MTQEEKNKEYKYWNICKNCGTSKQRCLNAPSKGGICCCTECSHMEDK